MTTNQFNKAKAILQGLLQSIGLSPESATIVSDRIAEDRDNLIRFAVGRTFAAKVTSALSPEQQRELRTATVGILARGDNICASHEFMDPNVEMEEALNEFGIEFDHQDEGVLALWSAAWDYAKENLFWIPEGES